MKRYKVKNLFGDEKMVLNEKNEYVLLKKNETAITTKPNDYMNNEAFKVTEIKEIKERESDNVETEPVEERIEEIEVVGRKKKKTRR